MPTLKPLQDLLGPSILQMVPNDTTELNALNDLTGAPYKGESAAVPVRLWIILAMAFIPWK